MLYMKNLMHRIWSAQGKCTSKSFTKYILHSFRIVVDAYGLFINFSCNTYCHGVHNKVFF